MNPYNIRCVVRDIPEPMQFIYGLLFDFRGSTHYITGITKEDLAQQLHAKSWSYWI